jgi:tRNA 2-thiocytidine biosynthesis protein TtcA
MENIKRVLSYVRRAVDDYKMIADGDNLAVGVSGGKDSLTLLIALAELRRFYPNKFSLCAITIDMGFERTDFSAVAGLCGRLGVPYHILPTEIAKVIFDIRREPNPCSLCARMRRGALHASAKGAGCNKVALGHHFDDVVETFMLNLFFEGRIGCFQPVTYLSRRDITLIRPMIYMPEKDVRYFVSKAKLPVVESTCPANRHTEREEMKKLLATLERQHKGLRQRIFGAILRGGVGGFCNFGRLEGIKQYEEEQTK